MPAFAVRHGRVGEPFKQVPGHFNVKKKIVGRFLNPISSSAISYHKVKGIHLLPHLRRNDLSYRAGILASGTQTGNDRVGVFFVEGEELNDPLARRRTIPLGE